MVARRRKGFGVMAYLRDLVRSPPLLAWSMFITLIPFYVFDSGLPQPGDFFLLIAAPMALAGWDGRLPNGLRPPLKPLLWFVIYVAVVNYGWAVILGNWELHGKKSFILFPVYYTFNAIVFLCVVVLFRRFGDRFLRVTVNSVFVAVGVQVAWSFIFQHGRLREAMFFNNANQLGYYALLAACVIAVCQKKLKMSMLRASIGVTTCTYLALLSASRAAAGGIVVIFLVTFVSNPKIILATIPIVIGGALIGGPITRAFEATQQRVTNDQFKQYTFLEERGLGRLEDNPEYLMLGAGEGGTDRFEESLIGTHEIHSSPLALLFSYGVVGTSIFLAFMFRVIRGATLKTALILMPILAFTVAHVGLRASMLWVLLGVFTIVKRREPARAPAPAPAPTPVGQLARA
jgi:hypothetical protein